ncbi:uncharacterized protein F4822DRAFT_280692 [Hypoxylon trugodes]|uniref:uncharacterized protein n=1 Tax=Hypoxylon trugodes TaxID=326681 RepID=UPI002197A7AB|nr:uncharacterized protein F4822DRAFT_280692 [Hypoxylon trugodes]KAI1387391.1 hypothetical protein F4822DRAFT_280692 [Hypoxylon trugodes]
MPARTLPVGGTPSAAMTNRARGFVSIHEASCLLSHRHASRENDEVIIWSLLCGDDVKETAIDLWRSMVNRIIPTGFLMSSHPRIGYEVEANGGFGWAPRRPDMPGDDTNGEARKFFADDGSKSTYGFVKPEGFRAKWLVAEFKTDLRLRRILNNTARDLKYERFRVDRELQRIAAQYLESYRWGALIQPGEAPLADAAIQYRSDSDGVLVAIIGSNCKEKWYWMGVYEWKVSIPLPALRRREILLV